MHLPVDAERSDGRMGVWGRCSLNTFITKSSTRMFGPCCVLAEKRSVVACRLSHSVEKAESSGSTACTLALWVHPNKGPQSPTGKPSMS